MNLYDYLPVFKVVEINNVVGLRSGHIIAQSMTSKGAYGTGTNVGCENGYIMYLDLDNKLKAPRAVDAQVIMAQAPILHYTEELFTGISEELKHFSVEWDASNEAYPRGLVLALGDTFTTDNYSGTVATATLAGIDTDGAFVLFADKAAAVTATYAGPLFTVVPTTLPDGETDAVELTLISNYIDVA